MLTPLWHVTLPDLDDNSVEAHFAPLVFALEGMIKINEFHINRQFKKWRSTGRGTPFPPLFASGVFYEEDPPGQENWRDCFAILEKLAKTKHGSDCDNLVCWRVAELRCAGIAAEPVIKWQHIPAHIARRLYPTMKIPDEGLWMIHCCVRFPDGSVEDTSKLLGMGGSFTNRT